MKTLLRTADAIQAQLVIRVRKAVRGWLCAGYYLCGGCGKVTEPVEYNNSNVCCWCGSLIVPKDFVPPVKLD